MRKYIFSVVMFCGLASAQAPIVQQNQPFPTDNRPLTGEEWRLNLVERLMSFPSPVTNGAFQLYGMGDEAAVDVIKILSAKPSPSLDEIQATLDIVHMAFQHPESIIEPVNQKPRAALFLLQHLASTTSDGLLAERITNELGFLRAAMVVSTPNLSTAKQ
jgi:hypothetical protein